jgi:hypothetical protein
MSESLTPLDIRLAGQVTGLKGLLTQFMVLAARGENIAARLDDLEANLSHLELDPEAFPLAEGWGDAPRQLATNQAVAAVKAILEGVRKSLPAPRRSR